MPRPVGQEELGHVGGVGVDGQGVELHEALIGHAAEDLDVERQLLAHHSRPAVPPAGQARQRA
ncbi:MAG: hypothetical protein IPN01_15135 [Deltaproteobacteria bacterium]|nr:hypothetical protein [Deltaproteobacteria bacterium]